MTILFPYFRISLVVVLLGTAVQSAHAGRNTDKTWPCVQRKVPLISIGVVWSGPKLDEKSSVWVSDRAVAPMVAATTSRRISIDEAQAKIAAFAKTLKIDRAQKLLQLFTGQFQTINRERRDIVRGIGRYAKRQIALSEAIKTTAQKLDALRVRPALTDDDKKQRDTLQEKLNWDTRIYDAREKSLQFVCETPVLLEQRLYAFGKQIRALIARRIANLFSEARDGKVRADRLGVPIRRCPLDTSRYYRSHTAGRAWPHSMTSSSFRGSR